MHKQPCGNREQTLVLTIDIRVAKQKPVIPEWRRNDLDFVFDVHCFHALKPALYHTMPQLVSSMYGAFAAYPSTSAGCAIIGLTDFIIL